MNKNNTNAVPLNTTTFNTRLLNTTRLNTNGFPMLSKRSGSSADISQAIMDSLVCWYDIGKQQCTNESMAANPVLADLSGNGHDITCYNFGWSGMSGIGGYIFNRNLDSWYKSSNNNGTYTTEGNVLHITKLNTNTNSYYVTCNSTNIIEISGNEYTTKPFKIKISGLPENKQVRINGIVGNDTVSPNIPKLYEPKYFGNGEHIVESSSVVWDNEELEPNVLNYPYLYVDSDTADDVDITIEILPEYPNALVSDGVDDYCYTEGLPILTDYTVIAKRKILNKEIFGALASKKSSNYSDNGSFFFENVSDTIQDANLIQLFNFGATKNLLLYQDDISYQTRTHYNSEPITSGDAIDTDKLTLFKRFTNSNQFRSAALYSFLLFDRTLTTAEIEWVKQNMIESGGVLATDWSDSSLWIFRNGIHTVSDKRVEGTLSSNMMVITSCIGTNNFMETNVDFYVPGFRIKVTGLKNGIRLLYLNNSIRQNEITEDGIYTLSEQRGSWIGFRFNKAFENENIVIQQLLS